MIKKTHYLHLLRASALALAINAAFGTIGTHAAQAQAREGAIMLDIPAGPLGEALIRLSRATGLRVAADPATLAGHSSAALRGSFTVDQALVQLLAGQNLSYQLRGRTLLIRPATAPSSDVRRRSRVAVTAGDVASGDILVVGTRADAGSSAFRSTQPVAMLSAADLQHTATHNAAEILGLLPSVNVMQNGSSFLSGSNAYAIDGASRGEGQFVSVRGMNSEYNVTLLNGVEVAQAQAYSRAVQLNLLPPAAVQTVILHKTSTPDMNGDAIGGTIDFRTPTAFDFKERSHGSISVSGRLESQALRLDTKGGGYGIGPIMRASWTPKSISASMSAAIIRCETTPTRCWAAFKRRQAAMIPMPLPWWTPRATIRPASIR